MIPELSTNLATMLKTVEEIILPALPPAEAAAVEQTHLVIRHLKLANLHHDKIVHFRLAEIRQFSAMITEILSLVQQNGEIATAVQFASDLVDESAGLTALRLPCYPEIAGMALQLREVADQLLSTLSSRLPSDQSRALQEIMFRHAAAELVRARAWVASAGFDSRPEEIPSLEMALGIDD